MPAVRELGGQQGGQEGWLGAAAGLCRQTSVFNFKNIIFILLELSCF